MNSTGRNVKMMFLPVFLFFKGKERVKKLEEMIDKLL